MKYTVLFLIALFLMACSGGTTNNSSSTASNGGTATKPQTSASEDKIEMTLDGKTSTLNLKQGAILVMQQNSTGPDSMTQFQMHIATFEISKTDEAIRPLTTDGETRIMLEVYGKRGTTRDTPLAKETFPANVAGSTNDYASFGSVSITTFADGKEVKKTPIDFLNLKRNGEIKFTEVNGDVVKATVDLTIGDKLTLKGNFTVKVMK